MISYINTLGRDRGRILTLFQSITRIKGFIHMELMSYLQ